MTDVPPLAEQITAVKRMIAKIEEWSALRSTVGHITVAEAWRSELVAMRAVLATLEAAQPQSECEFDPDHLYHDHALEAMQPMLAVVEAARAHRSIERLYEGSIRREGRTAADLDLALAAYDAAERQKARAEAEAIIESERDARHKCEAALTAKDKAMGVLFERLTAAGVDCSDLIP